MNDSDIIPLKVSFYKMNLKNIDYNKKTTRITVEMNHTRAWVEYLVTYLQQSLDKPLDK